jgi:hypothetical protein
MQTRRLAILHIGGEKTGSTTLQCTLAANRKALAAEGILYSRVAGPENHILLALHATAGWGSGDLRAMAGLTDDDAFAEFLDTFPDRLREEAEASGARVFVYSNEHLSSRIRDAEGVRRLWALLGPVADEIRIAYYARPQEELVASGWSTMVKSGSAAPFDLDHLLRHGTPLDHHQVLDRWGAFFADPYWILRPYQRQAMAGGDIVEDFLVATGIPAGAVPRRIAMRNRSLDAVTAEFLRLYNAATGAEPGNPRTPARGQLVALLEALSDGPPVRLGPEQAAEVAARFAAGNGAVARRLLGRDALFLPSPPVPAEPPRLTAEEAVRIAAELWRVAQERPPPP